MLCGSVNRGKNRKSSFNYTGSSFCPKPLGPGGVTVLRKYPVNLCVYMFNKRIIGFSPFRLGSGNSSGTTCPR